MIEIILGFLLDLIVGDPQNPIHPIRIIGSLCKTVEKFFRSILKRYLKVAGLLTWILVVFIVFIFNTTVAKVCSSISHLQFELMILYLLIFLLFHFFYFLNVKDIILLFKTKIFKIIDLRKN